MRNITIFLVLAFSSSAYAEGSFVRAAKDYLSSLGYENIDGLKLEVSEFKYDLDGNGKKEIQVSPKCNFEKRCQKVIFSDSGGVSHILFYLNEYDYWPVLDTGPINGYHPLRYIEWHGNFSHSIYIWVAGSEDILNCTKAIEVGITWPSQDIDCKHRELRNP